MINWALAGLAALIMSAAYLLDGPTDLQAAADTAASVRHAERQAQVAERFEQAAQKACGQNAGWQLRSDGAVQCLTKRGHRTTVVAVR
jgi:2-keto-3-deoxy-L-rhamnonate aldolase RhmA